MEKYEAQKLKVETALDAFEAGKKNPQTGTLSNRYKSEKRDLDEIVLMIVSNLKDECADRKYDELVALCSSALEAFEWVFSSEMSDRMKLPTSDQVFETPEARTEKREYSSTTTKTTKVKKKRNYKNLVLEKASEDICKAITKLDLEHDSEVRDLIGEVTGTVIEKNVAKFEKGKKASRESSLKFLDKEFLKKSGGQSREEMLDDANAVLNHMVWFIHGMNGRQIVVGNCM